MNYSYCQILYNVTGCLGFCFEKDPEGILEFTKIEYFSWLLNFQGCKNGEL